MPRIEDLTDIISNASYISTVDMCKGYWQLPMEKDSQQFTAFTTQSGKYEFQRIPFGLKNAPSVFQRFMNSILAPYQDFCRVYIDDICIFSETWTDHLKHLRTVMMALIQYKLTIKISKCQFGMKTCIFLGFKIGQGCIRPKNTKIEAIRDYRKPHTKKQMQAFLGLANYYRKFIKHFASIIAPLYDSIKKDLPNSIRWNMEMEKSFISIKEKLTSDPVLSSPKQNVEYCLQTDASGLGIGAVLCQRTGQNKEEDHPVAYFSKKFLKAESHYSAVEKECLALVKAIHHFHVYLVDGHFSVETDNKALVYLSRFKTTKHRLMNWAMMLQPYDFSISHRPGKDNGNADALSRQFNELE